MSFMSNYEFLDRITYLLNSALLWFYKYTIAQSAGAVEYTDCFSAEG